MISRASGKEKMKQKKDNKIPDFECCAIKETWKQEETVREAVTVLSLSNSKILLPLATASHLQR